MDPLCTLPATRLAALIAGREVTSREVVEAHLTRIDEVNGAVNAITVVLAEPALEGADAADAALASRPDDTASSRGADDGSGATGRGALHGVPFTVKENIDCVGSATTHGVPRLDRSMPLRDAPMVARMKAAGAIPIARTNLSEFALRIGAGNPLRGETLNPWDPRVTPGGSSGGDAAALATGMTPFGLGNDLGGSLRNPAYCCGVAALKPTTGRIPRAGSIPPLDFGWSMQTMAVDGPMARSVADLRLGLEVLSGRDVRDPRSVDAPLQGPAPAALRAALVTRIPGVELPPETVADVERAGLLLTAAGWEVEEAEPPELDLITATWLDFIAVDFSVMMPDLRPMISRALCDYMTAVCDMSAGRQSPNGELHARRSRLIRLWSEFFVRYPVAVGPTWTQPPWPLDADLEPGTGARRVYDTVRFITPGNLLGIPAVALPTGVAAGLPTGIQVYADLWREDLCLEAAAIIEAGVDAPAPIDPLR